MEEITIILKLNINNTMNETEGEFKAKAREYIAQIVGAYLNGQVDIKLFGSALAEEIEWYKTSSKDRLLRIVDTCSVISSN